jgi:hypothetical protein
MKTFALCVGLMLVAIGVARADAPAGLVLQQQIWSRGRPLVADRTLLPRLKNDAFVATFWPRFRSISFNDARVYDVPEVGAQFVLARVAPPAVYAVLIVDNQSDALGGLVVEFALSAHSGWFGRLTTAGNISVYDIHSGLVVIAAAYESNQITQVWTGPGTSIGGISFFPISATKKVGLPREGGVSFLFIPIVERLRAHPEAWTLSTMSTVKRPAAH